VTTAPDNPDPWRRLATVFWAGGWVLIFLAIANSALASANAGATAATRVVYALARNGTLPRGFARTHPTHRTPHVAVVAQGAVAIAVALLAGWAWGPQTGFVVLATAATIVVIVVYIAVCLASIAYFRRRGFRPVLHGAVPLLGAAAFAAPLYFQYRPLPPYPIRYGNWIAAGWLAAGFAVCVWMTHRRRHALVAAAGLFDDDQRPR
jgi:amino acid transporter